eukprot:comp15881_c0_seq1/m.13228 comp15881_c0_seq1/g.13228  ORF comp15881_c0_seq1/g.13228 comp15881_c0_seq1/m.13228 type:complete len:426 (-) comp15881_c0_seq1:384-1661(-)
MAEEEAQGLVAAVSSWLGGWMGYYPSEEGTSSSSSVPTPKHDQSENTESEDIEKTKNIENTQEPETEQDAGPQSHPSPEFSSKPEEDSSPNRPAVVVNPASGENLSLPSSNSNLPRVRSTSLSHTYMMDACPSPNLRGKTHLNIAPTRQQGGKLNFQRAMSEGNTLASTNSMEELPPLSEALAGVWDYVKTAWGSTETNIENPNSASSNAASDQSGQPKRSVSKVEETAEQARLRKLEEERLLLEFPGWACVELEGTSNIINPNVARTVAQHLPPGIHDRNWSLLYSTYEHGTSLHTLYRRCHGGGPCVLIIKESEDYVFGGYTSQPIESTEGKYVGNGECFLFSLKPEFKVYPWTSRNRYFFMGADKSFHMGSGGGAYGLWLDGTLRKGQSQTCDTFDNPPLASSEFFTILGVEVWGFKGLQRH